MATHQPPQEEIEEAVIISGARNGSLIRLTNGEVELSEAEQALLDEVIEIAQRLAENTRATSAEAEALLAELRQARAEYRGSA